MVDKKNNNLVFPSKNGLTYYFDKGTINYEKKLSVAGQDFPVENKRFFLLKKSDGFFYPCMRQTSKILSKGVYLKQYKTKSKRKALSLLVYDALEFFTVSDKVFVFLLKNVKVIES